MEEITYIAHHGVQGQKWGVRRYQNDDGTLTASGRKRYARQETRALNKLDRDYSDYAYRANEAASKQSSVLKRRNALIEKGISDESKRIGRLDARAAKQEAIFKEKATKASEVDSQIKAKVDSLSHDGYAIATKPTIRDVKLTAAEAAANTGAIFAGVAALAVTHLPFVFVPQVHPHTTGTSYKIKDSQKSE